MSAYEWEDQNQRADRDPDVRHHWLVRVAAWVIRTFHPALGWFAFLAAVGLTLSVLAALRAAGWGSPRQAAMPIEWLGFWMVAVPWAVYTFFARRRQGANRPGLLLPMLAHLLAGPIAISQVLAGWLPSVPDLWRTWRTPALSGGWPELGWQMVADLQRLGTRLLLWAEGVRSGGATQDDLVFLALALAVIWLVGGLSVTLLLGRRSGLAGALPLIWLLGTIVFYSGEGRWLLVLSLGFGIALHLLLDQQRLFADWDVRRVAYTPDVMIERIAITATVSFLILLIAAILPNLYFAPLARAAYSAMGPWNDRLTAVGDRFFPEMQRDFYGGIGAGELGGLPNSFLLGAGQDLGDRVVMRVRTNETRMVGTASSVGPDIAPQPVGHYMRGATLSIYTGQGWENPTVLDRREIPANQPWAAGGDLNPELRRPLLQSVFLSESSPVLFAAPEPVEATVATRAELGPTAAEGPALVALRPENRSAARSYTVLSSLPNVDEVTLSALPPLSTDGELNAYLALPDTITPRTRELAAALGADAGSAYEIAAAIERRLRAIPYDLAVGEPPREVTDVADYFLFDLQRGYCDYYATAFIVLARLNGLPARFATGYAVGNWEATERMWTITEAEAHSWPEVYFPQVGWVPFEPTAGRPALVREAPIRFPDGQLAEDLPEFEPFEPVGIDWNLQMLFWLLPIGLLIWAVLAGVWRWRVGREDAWLGLLAWGRRLGRPAGDGETELEYGQGLAVHVAGLGRRTPEQRRVVSREILALSQEAGQIHYGPEAERPPLRASVHTRWRRLRGYLLRLWLARRSN